MRTAESTTDAQEQSAASPIRPSDSAAGGLFTRYVRAIACRSEAVDEMVPELSVALRKALVREMRWRSLWASPPAYVGILGWPSWTPGDTEGTAPPLADFLADCYLFVFGKRLRHLLNQLRVSSKIDGLVIVYIRHFLTDRQKHHDPLGYRLFEVLCTAVRRSVAVGDLHVLRGPSTIRNATVLGAVSEADPVQASPTERLRPPVARWNDTLLPSLVTAEREARRKLNEDLRGCLANLEAQGVSVFRFKDLLDALKEDVRARWGFLQWQQDGEIVLEEADDGVRRLVRILWPETRVEDLDSFKKLVRCVSSLIPKVDARQKSRSYLEQLWNFLRRWSLSDRETLPTYRKLERALKIPRGRFAGLYKTLGQLTLRCQGKLAGAVVEIDAGRHHAGRSSGGSDG